MEISQVVMVAGAVGVIGMLVGSWFKAQSLATRTSVIMSPAKIKCKAGTKKCSAKKADDTVAADIVSPNTTKKRRGRPAKVSALVKHQSTAPVDAGKKRRGRPTKAEVAARLASVTTGMSNAIETDSAITVKHAVPNQDNLLEMFLNLSSEQMHALASMPVGASPAISKESLTT